MENPDVQAAACGLAALRAHVRALPCGRGVGFGLQGRAHLLRRQPLDSICEALQPDYRLHASLSCGPTPYAREHTRAAIHAGLAVSINRELVARLHLATGESSRRSERARKEVTRERATTCLRHHAKLMLQLQPRVAAANVVRHPPSRLGGVRQAVWLGIAASPSALRHPALVGAGAPVLSLLLLY